MKFKKLLFLLFLIAGIVNILPAKHLDKNTTENVLLINSIDDGVVAHVVAKGETVYSIAVAYKTTVEEIYRLNPGSEQGIKVGSTLQIPKQKTPSGYSNHTIELKETLFSVSRLYNITVDDIKSANPGLDEDTFKTGKTIRIPIYSATEDTNRKNGYANPFFEYKVGKGDTLYSIGKAYNVSVETLYNLNSHLNEGLKEGMILHIPKKQVEDLSTIAKDEVVQAQTAAKSKKEDIIKVGILLPFLEETGSVQKDKIMEYYEGFLLAVKDMKERGLNAEIYTFDIGGKDTKRLENLLGTNEMNNLNLIIGGISKQQIDLLTRFSKKTGIKYVIPFESRDTEVESTPNIFQMTTSHVSLYDNVISAFISKFGNYNIIFVSESGSDNDKSDFVSELKKELTKGGIQFKTTASTTSQINDIKNVLSATKKNILIPTSSSEISLRRLTATLKSLPDGSDINLFGYPEWQTYSQLTSNLYQYNTHIYTIFFLDEHQRGVQEFVNEYKKWYNISLINSYPKYGFLGYDTGLYFLGVLNKYGSYFENNIPQFKAPTLQSAIHFKQVNNRGGFINKGLYFVNYKTDLSIEKTDISK